MMTRRRAMMMRRGMEAEVTVQPSMAATKQGGDGRMRAAIDGCDETRGNKRQTRGDARVNYTSSFFILL
jgi:hypothetical protein